MRMIWHDAPCQKMITLIVKTQQSVLRHLCNFWITQRAITCASIEIFFEFNPAVPNVLNFQEMLPFAAARLGHRITQAKRDKLNQIRKITMWQIAAFVPAEKTKFSFIIGQRPGPQVLFGNELLEVLSFCPRLHLPRH